MTNAEGVLQNMAGAQVLSQPLTQSGLSDAVLIAKCKASDRHAFDMLVERYQTRVYNYIRRMINNADEADDIAQDVFVRAYLAINKFDGRANMATWLLKIAVNLCIDYSRKKNRRPDTLAMIASDGEDEQLWDAPDVRYDPERLTIEDEMSQVVDSAIGRLSPKLREALILHDMENLSYEDMATVLGCPIGTVKSRLFLARSELQKVLSQYLSGGEAL